ncbi:CHAT domain-containing protein [Lactifluus subvellereus]|nr:CHAT domain-containing protein [Lactifluus subvellereus]
MRRYKLSDAKEDLDNSIIHCTEAIGLPLPWPEPGPSPLQFSLWLVDALICCSRKFKQPDDTKDCIERLRNLRDQPLDAFDVTRDQVTSSLVEVLGIQVELESGNVMQDIEEMAILCHELLASNIPESSLMAPLMALVKAVRTKYSELGEPRAQVIECLQEANKRLPDFHRLSFALAISFTRRFYVTNSIDDYEKAMATLDGIMTSTSHSTSHPSQDIRIPTLTTITALAWARAANFGKPEYLEEASNRLRTYLDKASLDDPHRHQISMALEQLAERRLLDFGVRGVEEAGSGDRGFVGDLSLSSLTGSLTESSLSSEQRTQHLRKLYNLIDGITDVPEMEQAIKCCRLLVASFHHDPNHPLAYFPHHLLGTLLFRAFMRTDKIEYLDESVALQRDILKVPDARPIHSVALVLLLRALQLRIVALRDGEKFGEIMRLFPLAVNDTSITIPERFNISCDWAKNARLLVDPSITAAYDKSISMMQDSLYYAPTLESQHFHLVTMRDNYEKLPLDYASYQVHIGQLEQAVETLERGRALLWSEMRGFRTVADQLGAVDSALASKFIATNRELEKLTMSMVPCGNMEEPDTNGVEGLEGMDPFGRLVVGQRKLFEKRDKLILEIRTSPNFRNFLMSPSFDTLRSAASRGPIIIINHSKWRSDILILLHDSPISLITTDDGFYDRANELNNRLVETRKEHRLESKQYRGALRSVLESLYELVGKPVIEEFRKLKIPEQSRVWWCPTSVFCSLPLHAMGPIPSDDGVKRYFSDLYIPSYTPTLSALIESRKLGGQSSGKPPILLVAQPESLRDANPEISLIQCLGTKVTSLISKEAPPSEVVDGLMKHRFAHFACHGTLEQGKPFNASFRLYGGERLTLLDIVRSQPPTAEFAFLSACHTAEMTDGSIADEGLHLTAAMQYCGFRSVVGTMWAMADADGRDLVEKFYQSILPSKELEVPYYERSAQALRNAVKKLRGKKGVPLERWVNYVHYGV